MSQQTPGQYLQDFGKSNKMTLALKKQSPIKA